MDPSASSSPEPNASTLSLQPASHKRQTGSSGSNNNNAGNVSNAPIPDEEHGADMPMTMTASVVLTSLPRDAHQALADAEAVDTGKSGLFDQWFLRHEFCLT